MRLACQEHLLPGAGLVDKWAFAQDAGLEGIELLGRSDLGGRLPELRAAARAGVVMPTACVQSDRFVGDFDPARRRDAIGHMKLLLSVVAELGGAGAVTPASYGMFSRRLPPFEPPRGPAEDREVLLEGLVELGEHAARAGSVVLLEPLNRYEDHMLNTLAQATELAEATGLATVRVMADVFHMNLEEADPAAAVRAAGPRLAHLHLADSNRLEPGRGHTDFAPVLAALRETGFEGFMALECRLSGDAREVLPAAVRFLRAAGA